MLIQKFEVKEYGDIDDFFFEVETAQFVFKELYGLDHFGLYRTDFWKTHTEVEVIKAILDKLEGNYIVYHFSEHWESGYSMTGVSKILVIAVGGNTNTCICGEN